jgi:hypothetical protein
MLQHSAPILAEGRHAGRKLGRKIVRVLCDAIFRSLQRASGAQGRIERRLALDELKAPQVGRMTEAIADR